MTDIIKETDKGFEKGYYTFQFWFFDNEDKKRYKTCCINDPLPFGEAHKIAKQHISEFGESGMCYFRESIKKTLNIKKI